MLPDWLHGDLHHWAIFCCTIASLGLVGAFWVALAAAGGKGIFAFLNGNRAPTVIVVNPGGQYVQQKPARRHWGFARIWLLCAAIFSGGPMLTLLILGANHAAWYVIDWLGRNWWAPIIIIVLAIIIIAFALLIRRSAADDREDRAQLAALPASVSAPTVAAQPLWSAPAVEGNWSDRA